MNACPDCGRWIYDDAVHDCAPRDVISRLRADPSATQAGYEAARLEVQSLRETVIELRERLRLVENLDDWR